MLWRAVKWLTVLGVAGLVASFAIVASATYYFASRGLGPALESRADVIIVLSAGLDRDLAILDSFSRDRAATAVELWRRGRAPVILMSGGVDPRINQHVGERMKRTAIELGAPELAVQVEGKSISTFENTRFTVQRARSEGWRSAIVVTDDFHLLRARALFEFWREGDNLDIVALAPASGRETAETGQFAFMLGRETLALPYNVGKVALQLIVDAAGFGDERIVQ